MLRSDAVLEQDVTAELACDVDCHGAPISVRVSHGVVTLSGIVPHQSFAQAAVRAVKRVFGVDGVHSHIAVESCSGGSAVNAAPAPDAFA